MRIGGMARDGLMTVIPFAVAVVMAMIVLGGPGEAARAAERVASDAWLWVAQWLRR